MTEEDFDARDILESARQVPIEELTAALQSDEPLTAIQLIRLSMASSQEMSAILALLTQIPPARLEDFYEDLQALTEANFLVDFEPIFIQGIQNPSPTIRQISLRGLEDSETESLVPRFVEVLNSDANPDVRAQSAGTLGGWIQMGELEEMEVALFDFSQAALLQAANEDKSDLVRQRALESLGFSSHPDVPALIEAAFTSGGEAGRASALLAMGRSADPRWKELVLKSLDHANNDIRRQAAFAAGALFLEDAAPALHTLLADDDRDVRRAAAWALSEVGGEGAREALESLLALTEDEEEIEEIENAIDNLIFNQGVDDFGLMSLDPDDFDLLDDED
ncbi:MAG: HEAT repeat domain-containing protein [Chloroflexi bacterium]|nr:HEAT repeat domain-containing protein [Chloroflexota bacterium]